MFTQMSWFYALLSDLKSTAKSFTWLLCFHAFWSISSKQQRAKVVYPTANYNINYVYCCLLCSLKRANKKSSLVRKTTQLDNQCLRLL